MSLQERVLDTQPGPIAYVAGPRTGPPVVFLHGIAGRWQYFLPVLDGFLSRWQVFALDARGHGGSCRVAGGYQLSDFAHDTAGFLDSMGLAPAILYGHSYGALVALLVAARYPERVHALILEDPPLFVHHRLERTHWLRRFQQVHELAGQELSGPAGIARLREARPGEPDVYYRYWAQSLRQLDPEVMAMYLDRRATQNFNVEATLGEVACPTLLLQADPACGGALSNQEAERSVALLSDYCFARLEGAPHRISAARPLEVLQLVRQFLEPLRPEEQEIRRSLPTPLEGSRE